MPKVSEKIRILFCMNHIIMGGLEKVLCQYLLALKKYPNIKVSVVSKEKVIDPYFIDFFKKNKIMLFDNFISFQKKKFLFIKLGDNKRKLINKIANSLKWQRLILENDIFIDFANFSYAEEFSEIKKKKFAWCHGSILFFNEYCQGKPALGNYDKIVCLSESFKHDMFTRNPELGNKITCIYNPIDVATTKKLAEEELFIDCANSYFVAVQRLDNLDKDVTTVIKGFNQYSKTDKTTKLYIVGNGPDRAPLLELAKNNPNIICMGQINNPYPLIKNAKALILSSTKKIGEGLPNTLLEAQALDTLCVSSNVKSGVGEILLNGSAGLLFEAQNPQSLAEKLLYLKGHPKECQQMVQIATANLGRFSVETAMEKFKKLCEIQMEG